MPLSDDLVHMNSYKEQCSEEASFILLLTQYFLNVL